MSIRISQRKTAQSGKAPIYASIYINREKIEIPTRVSVDPKWFDSASGKIKPSCPFAKDMNMMIGRVVSQMNDILVKARLTNVPLTKEKFRAEMANPGAGGNFIDFVRASQQIRFQEISFGTVKKHKAVMDILAQYCKGVLIFADMDFDFFRKFVIYLRKKRGNKEVTIRKDLQVISIYINEAIRKGYLTHNPTKGVPVATTDDEPRNYLTEEELDQLVNLYRKNELSGTFQDVLRFFLFMCFSSLHIGDAKNMMIEQIGREEFTYNRGKMVGTHPKQVRVPISAPLRELIEYYRGKRKNGKLILGMISDQKINQYLKIIANVAGLEKPLMAKMGRHTFATIFLKRTLDLNVLQKIMGHSKIEQTMVYAHVMNSDRLNKIRVFDDFGK